jgi:hypothetical protein
MALTSLDYVTAISTSIMMLVGLLMSIIAFKIWLEKKNIKFLLTAILFFALPFPWLNQVLIIVSTMFDIVPNTIVGVYLTVWSIPTLVITWLYITTSLYSKQWVRYISLFVGVVLGVYVIIRVYIQDAWGINNVPNTVLYNIEYSPDVELVIAIFGLMGLLIVTPTYYYFSSVSEDPLFKFRSRMIAIAAFIFSIAGVADAILILDTIVTLLLLRVMLLISLILLYLGYITPNMIRKRYES